MNSIVINDLLISFFLKKKHNFLFPFFSSICFYADLDSEYNSYIVIDSVPKTDYLTIKLRDKRDVSTQNPTPSPDNNETNKPTIKLESNQQLVGANGTGQRKDITNTSTTVKPSVVSDPLNADNAKQSSKTLLNSPKEASTVTDNVTESIFDEVDVPEESINKTIDSHKNLTLKLDYFNYYNTTTLVDKDRSTEFWSNGKNYTLSHLLSNSHRRAIVSKPEKTCFFFLFF